MDMYEVAKFISENKEQVVVNIPAGYTTQKVYVISNVVYVIPNKNQKAGIIINMVQHCSD